MELRKHPMMVCDGVMMWPPRRLQTHGPRNGSVVGEVGTLEAVFLSQVTVDRILLTIKTEDDNCYIGALLFEKKTSAKAIFDLLFSSQIGKPIEAIGSLEIPEDFGSR